MKKFLLRFHDFSSAGYPWIAVLSAFFLCGSVIGCITASYIDDVSGAALSGYVGSYLSAAKSAAQTPGHWPDMRSLTPLSIIRPFLSAAFPHWASC